MDTGRGRFEVIEDPRVPELFFKENAMHIFRVGEEVQVKGSRLKVIKITPKKLVLRLLPRKEKVNGT